MKHNLFLRRKNFLLTLPILALTVLSMVLMITPRVAMSQQTGDFCIGHFTPGAVCTAQDVRIRSLTPVSIIKDCTTAPNVGYADVIFEMLVSAAGSPNRYDIGTFLALEGGSAKTGNSCFHDYLPPPLLDFGVTSPSVITNGPWWNGDGGTDTCGDIAAGTELRKTLAPVHIRCVDTNGDGNIDVDTCVSWDNKAAINCTGVANAFSSTKSKCYCALINTGITMPLIPAISVTKTPDTQAVVSGGPAEFNITVTNTGQVALHSVVVTDPQCDTLSAPTGNGAPTTLGIGPANAWTYTCTKTNVTQAFTNTVTVTGLSPSDQEVTDTATADVSVDTPLISVLKTPGLQTVQSGGTATFTITVTNPGSVALGNIQVTDPQCSTLSAPVKSGGNQDALLDVGETWTYTCTVDNVTSGFINDVTVTGTVVGGPTVSDNDDAQVRVQSPPAKVIPTMTEWGMIIFIILAGLGSIYYIRRHRRA